MKKVLVTGGRAYQDREAVWEALNDVLPVTGDFMVIHGGATGADSHARSWCEQYGVIYAEVPADHLWHHLGKSAGPLRNAAMVALLVADVDRDKLRAWVDLVLVSLRTGNTQRALHKANELMMMLNDGWTMAQTDLVLAFPGGAGTASCVAAAEKAGIPVRKIEHYHD